MKFKNTLRERVLTLDFLSLLGILIFGCLCHILPVPEIVKGFFAVPASFLFYYLLGSIIYFVAVLKLFKKDVLELKGRDLFSRAIFFFFLGFVIWLFIIHFLNLLDFILFEFQKITLVDMYIVRFIQIYLFFFIFIFNIFWTNPMCVRIYELGNLFIKNKVVLIVFILLSSVLFLIANYYIPIGSLRMGFASPVCQYMYTTHWMTVGHYIDARIFENSLVYIGTSFFNIDANAIYPLIYSWIAPFFVMLFALFGIYLWVYTLTNNKIFSVMALVIGGLCFGTTVEAGNSILSAFKGNYIFPVMLPFLFFFFHTNTEPKEKLQKNIFVYFFVLCIIGLWLANIPVDPFVGFFRRFAFVIIILLFTFIILKSHDKEKINQILLLFSFFALFTHSAEFQFFVGILILYYVLLKINFKIKSNIFYFTVAGIILLNLMSIHFVISNPQNYHILDFVVAGSYASEYSINWKIDALRYYFVDNIFIFGIVILGYILLLAQQITDFEKKYLPIIGVFAFCVFVYFFPEGLSYRIEKFTRPFLAFMIVFFLYQIKEFYERRYSTNRFGKGFILILMFLLIFYISFTLLDTFYAHSIPYGNLPTKSIFADYEYKACAWMRTNLSENYVILSDWMTSFGMTPLCKKSTFIYPDMSNMLEISSVNKEKYLVVKNEVFGANSSEESYRGIKKLSNMPAELLYSKDYIKRMSLKNPEFTKNEFVVVLTDRTIKWLDSDCPKNYAIPPMQQLYSLEKIDQKSKYLRLFENNTYFKLIYNDTNYIRIYVVLK